MNDSPHGRTEELRCFVTVDFECSYLPGRMARNLIVDPDLAIDTPLAGRLLELGFRRSGDQFYRPHCDRCDACLSLRIPVRHFRPDRGQRRCLRRNADLRQRTLPPEFREDHFELYRRYIASRHPGSSMANPTPDDYLAFLARSGIDTRFHEFRLGDELVAVAVTDHLPAGLSAVYTFFSPEQEKRGLGTFAILWQIEKARRLALPWLYLGYWIEGCQAMRYKARFKPAEYFHGGRWQALEAPA